MRRLFLSSLKTWRDLWRWPWFSDRHQTSSACELCSLCKSKPVAITAGRAGWRGSVGTDVCSRGLRSMWSKINLEPLSKIEDTYCNSLSSPCKNKIKRCSQNDNRKCRIKYKLEIICPIQKKVEIQENGTKEKWKRQKMSRLVDLKQIILIIKIN